MSLVRDEWLYSAEGIHRLQKALGLNQAAQLWVDPTTNSLKLSYLDDGDDEDEFLRSSSSDQP
jgi:hypothetical protein